MNMNKLLMQIMKSKNQPALINQLMQNNPNIANAMPIVKQIMNSGKSQREQLQMACKQGNVNFDEAEQTLKNLGINF